MAPKTPVFLLLRLLQIHKNNNATNATNAPVPYFVNLNSSHVRTPVEGVNFLPIFDAVSG